MSTGNRRSILILALGILALCLPVFSLFAQGDPIDPNDARRQAAFSIVEHIALETPMLETWAEATLGKEILLWDPSQGGHAVLPLLYDFEVLVENELVGYAQVAATPFLGTTGMSLCMGTRPFDIEASLNDAVNHAAALYPGVEIESALPVIYQYPRMAAMITLKPGWPWGVYNLFLELPTLRVIKDELGPALQLWVQGDATSRMPISPAPGKIEVVSLYDCIPDEIKLANVAEYGIEEEIVANAMEVLTANLDLDQYLEEPVVHGDWPVIKDILDQLQWTTDDMEVLPTHRCKLIKQEESDWCARAVAQMIMYYHYGMLFHTQTEIDVYMNAYGWDKKWAGAWEKAMKKYYTKWLNMQYSSFDPNISTSSLGNPVKQEAGWQNLKQQIDDGFPFCDGVPVHARMGMAYRIYGHNQYFKKYEVGIYDPEILTGGVRWELGWKEGMFGMSPVAPRYFLFTTRNTP